MATAIKAQIRALIQSGLYEANLRALLPLAEQLFHQRPVLYGTLVQVFKSLINEYDDFGAIPTSRLHDINSKLTQPLLSALDAEFDPADQLLARLNELFKAGFAL